LAPPSDMGVKRLGTASADDDRASLMNCDWSNPGSIKVELEPLSAFRTVDHVGEGNRSC
jgi:hypothetical protein